MPYLPISKKDMDERGISQLDFVYICGDAYVDHPSFGHAIISRVLESHGYSVGIISQPDWKDESSITVLGRPRLAFLVSSGNMDSMVNHYTVNKKKRSKDAYSPGGEIGKRPDRAVVVYGNLIRKKYKDVPIVIGGIEASLRRMSHYDYWSDSLKRSVLLDSGADIISYGMGEKSIVEIADALDSGILVSDITFIRGTVYKTRTIDGMSDALMLPSYAENQQSKEMYAKSFKVQYENTDPFTAKILIEEYDHNVYVVQNPPSMPLSMQEMDDIYALPYMNSSHPDYDKLGGIPAVEEVLFSITSNRGCFGGCNFCSLTFQQGRQIQVRSHESIIAEAKRMTEDERFKGYIHDVGGPTANFRRTSCDKQLTKGVCVNKQCLFPKPCKNLVVDHSDYLSLLRKLRKIPKIKKVFIRSGIRFDYLLEDKNDAFFNEMLKYHVSGQLRVAPEHICDSVLKRMGKPSNSVYERFIKKYNNYNKQHGIEQYAIPYLMSSHPGSTMKDAIALAEYIRDMGYIPKQVQDFYPTPSTISTVMYYTGIDCRDMSPVYVEKNPRKKAMQRALIQYRDSENYELVKEALLSCGRGDLIGYGDKCLIPSRPYKERSEKNSDRHNSDKQNSKRNRKQDSVNRKNNINQSNSSNNKSNSNKLNGNKQNSNKLNSNKSNNNMRNSNKQKNNNKTVMKHM